MGLQQPHACGAGRPQAPSQPPAFCATRQPAAYLGAGGQGAHGRGLQGVQPRKGAQGGHVVGHKQGRLHARQQRRQLAPAAGRRAHQAQELRGGGGEKVGGAGCAQAQGWPVCFPPHPRPGAGAAARRRTCSVTWAVSSSQAQPTPSSRLRRKGSMKGVSASSLCTGGGSGARHRPTSGGADSQPSAGLPVCLRPAQHDLQGHLAGAEGVQACSETLRLQKLTGAAAASASRLRGPAAGGALLRRGVRDVGAAREGRRAARRAGGRLLLPAAGRHGETAHCRMVGGDLWRPGALGDQECAPAPADCASLVPCRALMFRGSGGAGRVNDSQGACSTPCRRRPLDLQPSRRRRRPCALRLRRLTRGLDRHNSTTAQGCPCNMHA